MSGLLQPPSSRIITLGRSRLKIDWTHKSTQGLIGAWIPGVMGGIDLTGNSPTLAWQSGAYAGVGREGPESPPWASSGSAGALIGGNLFSQLLTWPNSTLGSYYRGQWKSSSTQIYSNLWYISYDSNTSTSPYFVAAVGSVSGGLSSGGFTLGLKWNNAGTLSQNTVAPMPASGTVSFAANFMVGGTYPEVWIAVPGTPFESYNNQQMTAASSFLSPVLGINSIDNVSAQCLYLWNRRIYGEEALALDQDPFAFIVADDFDPALYFLQVADILYPQAFM